MIVKKNIYFLLIIFFLLVAGGLTWWYLSLPKARLKPAEPLTLIDYLEPKMPAEQKQKFLDNLKKDQEELAALPTEEEKMSFSDKTRKFQLLLDIASTYYPLGELKKSFDIYAQASALFPNEPVPYYSMAYIAEQRGDLATARTNYRLAVEKSPAYGLYWRALIEFEQNRFSTKPEILQALFQDALIKTGNDINVVTLYAKFLEAQGDIQGAISEWQAALQQAPEYADLYQAEITRLNNLK